MAPPTGRAIGSGLPDAFRAPAISRSGLDRDGLTVRAAHARTGVAAADFSRIGNADLAGVTLDRLVGIINRLGARVEVKLKIKPTARSAQAAVA